MNATVGFYGKLPFAGDFISRRLPNEFVTAWDKWLQSALAASREELGAVWLEHYLVSPIWRFFLSAGVCGDKAVAGVVIPSLDKVARYYPFTVAVVFEQAPSSSAVLTENIVWFEQLEDAAIMGLAEAMDMHRFDKMIQKLPALTMPNPLMSVTEQSTGCSLWSNEGSDNVVHSRLSYQGLPPISHFADFLTGNFRQEDRLICSETIMNTSNLELASLSSILASPATKLDWQSWAITDTGKRRKHNEDSLLDRPEAKLWVVADGMGGHKAGDVASQLIVNSLKVLPQTQPLENYINAVEQCLQTVNSQLQQLAAKEYAHHLVGSTVVALVGEGNKAAFLWAGDSRLYRFRNNQLQQLTQDHCEGDDDGASAWSVKSSNVITRAVGATEQLEIDVGTTDVLHGDIFLLASDGLDKELSYHEIAHIIRTSDRQNMANALVHEVLACGARDNVTVIIVAVDTIL